MKLNNHSAMNVLKRLLLIPLTILAAHAQETVSTDKASDWVYEARVPKPGNSVEKAKADSGKNDGLRFKYKIGGAVGSDVFSMYAYKSDEPLQLSQLPSEVEVSVSGNDETVGIFLHFIDAKSVVHIYTLVKRIDWSGWQEIKIPWTDMAHAAWGNISADEAARDGVDVEVTPPLTFKGITIQGSAEEGQSESGYVQIKGFKFIQ